MDSLDQLTQYLLSGLANGAIYALIGFGFAVIFNATGIINFAQGEFVMLGGMATFFFFSVLNLPLPLAVLMAVAVSTAVGIAFEYLAIRPLRKPTPLALVIITIGVSILLRGIAMLIWGKDTHALPAFTGSEPLYFMDATLLPQHLWIFAITVVVIVLR